MHDEATPAATGTDGKGTDAAAPASKPDHGRPASYFSNVRSDAYRSGWDRVFGTRRGGGKGAGKRRRHGG